jgi:hypothetical protein
LRSGLWAIVLWEIGSPKLIFELYSSSKCVVPLVHSLKKDIQKLKSSTKKRKKRLLLLLFLFQDGNGNCFWNELKII